MLTSVFLSADGRYALSGSCDNTLKLWALDWELEGRSPADWDEAARPYMEIFLCQQTPYAAPLPSDREATEEEITLAPHSPRPAHVVRGRFRAVHLHPRLCRLRLALDPKASAENWRRWPPTGKARRRCRAREANDEG